MSLVGTICCQTGQPTPFDICEENSRAGACEHALPILVNMRKNADRREGIGISSSVLGGCPRQYVLGRTTDYYEDPEDYYARWLGSIAHYAIEMDGPYPGVIQEKRFYRTIDVDGVEVEVSGQPDWIDTNTLTIADHKNTGRKPAEVRQEHIQQLNVYRWLVEGGSTRETTERFVDFRRDGIPDYEEVTFVSWWGRPTIKKLEVRYYHPGTKRHTEFDVPIWEDHLVEDYIRRAIRPILHAEKTNDPNSVGLFGQLHAWRANYCPWRHDCNEGQCCLIP